MIYLIIDILIYNITNYFTYLILLNLNKKNNYFELLVCACILDFIVLKTYYKNIVIFLILILINKYLLDYKKTNLVNYLSINILNYSIFIMLSSFINNNFSYTNISITIINNFILYILIVIIYYYQVIIKK